MPTARNRAVRLARAASAALLAAAVAIIAAPAPAQAAYCDLHVDYTITTAWDGGHVVEVDLANTGISNVEEWRLRFHYDTTVKGAFDNGWNARFVGSSPTAFDAFNPTWQTYFYPDMHHRFGFVLTTDPMMPVDIEPRSTGIPCDLTVDYHSTY